MHYYNQNYMKIPEILFGGRKRTRRRGGAEQPKDWDSVLFGGRKRTRRHNGKRTRRRGGRLLQDMSIL
jgi:hypothetical protein